MRSGLSTPRANIVFSGGKQMLMPKPRKLTAEEEAAIERLKQAAKRRMTREEILEQIISWVYGNMGRKSGLTRDEVERLVRAQEGE